MIYVGWRTRWRFLHALAEQLWRSRRTGERSGMELTGSGDGSARSRPEKPWGTEGYETKKRGITICKFHLS